MKHTPKELAEQAGANETIAMLEIFRNCKTQAARLMVLHACINEIAASEMREPALAGFSVAILPYLDRGLGIQ